jgi:hypothetical protein
MPLTNAPLWSTCESHCYFLASTQNSDIFPSNRAEVQVKLQSGAKLSSSHFFENKHELYKKYKGTYYSSICRVTPTVVVMGFLCNWGTKWIWHSGFGTTRTSGENRQEMVRRCSLILWWGVTGKSQHISLEYTFNQAPMISRALLDFQHIFDTTFAAFALPLLNEHAINTSITKVSTKF